jgi:hypothetical protein
VTSPNLGNGTWGRSFFSHQLIFFPECLGKALGERILLKKQNSSPSATLREEGFRKNKFLPRVQHSGKRVLKKQIASPNVALREEVSQKKVDGTDGVKSSPSTRTALEECFPECTVIGTRGRPLPRERHPRRLFPECCTRAGAEPQGGGKGRGPPDAAAHHHHVSF